MSLQLVVTAGPDAGRSLTGEDAGPIRADVHLGPGRAWTVALPETQDFLAELQ